MRVNYNPVPELWTVSRTVEPPDRVLLAASRSVRAMAGSRLQQRRRGEDGAALVEFALVVPLMLIIMFSMTSFGFAFNRYLQLTEATNIGARLLSVSRGNTLDPCSLTATAIQHAAPYLTASQMTFTYSLNGNAESGTTCAASNSTSPPASYLVQGQPVSVTVTYPCTAFVWTSVMYKINPLPSCLLHAQITEITQ